jgi:hypothetical protein
LSASAAELLRKRLKRRQRVEAFVHGASEVLADQGSINSCFVSLDNRVRIEHDWSG